MRVLVAIPAFNEEATIGSVVQDVLAAGYDCVVVDDGSEDDTRTIARTSGAALLPLTVNSGVGGALRCAFRYAVQQGYERVIQCDADGQHPVDQINRLIETSEQTGACLVIGSRFADGGSSSPVRGMRRLAMTRLAGQASRAASRPLTDTTSGFRCISEPLLGQFARGYPHHYLADTFEALLVAARAGYPIEEVAVDMKARQGGVASSGSIRSTGYLLRALLTSALGLQLTIEPYRPGARVRAA